MTEGKWGGGGVPEGGACSEYEPESLVSRSPGEAGYAPLP